jgi:hypothetical protein
MSVVLTEHFEQELLAATMEHVTSGAFSGPLYGAQMILFTTPVALTAQTITSDLTQPTYTGYAAQDAVFGAPYRRTEGGIAEDTPLITWQQASTPTVTDVYGYAIVDTATPANLLFAETLPGGPYVLTDDLSAVLISAQFAVGGPDFGSATVTS